MIRNDLVDEFEKAGVPALSYPLQGRTVWDIYIKADETGDGRWMPLWAGQAISRIRDVPGLV